MTVLVLPFAPGLYGQDFNIGLLYFFAVGGLGVVGLLMGGWSSFNKYSLLGGLRSAAQIISYEIPLTLSVVGLAHPGRHDEPQHDRPAAVGLVHRLVLLPPAARLLIFSIAATAEANRTPFDLTEADSEIVAGFATEYSGMRFGFFFFAEYVNVFILSALTVVLFLGGWNAPFPLPAHLGWPSTRARSALAAIPARHRAGPGDADPGRAVLSRAQLDALVGRADHRLRPVQRPAVGLILTWGYISFAWVAGLFWFIVKTFAFVFLFVWMRGTLPRVRIDQLMGFAWKWLLPAALLNLFVTAAAVVGGGIVRTR